MSQPTQLPPVPGSPPNSSGVRRHHTISASSRTARAAAISEETTQDQPWNEDEVVGEDWVGGVGAVGEKSSLHRQSSLPTRYHRAFQPQASGLSRSGSLTPNTKNSLTAIAGHEGDEDDWEGDIDAYAVEEHPDAENMDPVDPNSPLVPHDGPSPPPADSSVRRHQSLTYGAAARQAQKNTGAGLRRAGTLQTPLPPQPAPAPEPPAEDEDEYTYQDDPGAYDESEYYAAKASPIGRLSPWSNNGSNDWRAPNSGFSSGSGGSVDEVQRALSSLEISGGGYNAAAGQSAHPPRFNPTHPPPAQAPGMRGNNGNGNGNGNGNNNGNDSRKLQLVTDFDGRKTPLGQSGTGPASASAVYVLQQAQAQQQQYLQQQQQQQTTGSAPWEQKDRVLGLRTSNPNLQYGYQQQQASKGQPVPPIPQQYLQQQQQPQQQRVPSGQTPTQGFVNTPVDVPSLIATKGYNPTNFELRPSFARYFVIKSYTEDDVHKSLKYEIWSSTEPGNKRLDKAFKECGGRGPIYLFFSVNASGHFCGMAEMLTPVDYTRSSTVWASDKWKGVFKVRWIFVRDIPNVNLRHIKLLNTTERKPVTNSRDTQELLAEAGQEMLRIFHTHPARTSLLQDFAFYELQAMQKMQGQGTPGASSPSSPTYSGGGSTHSPQMSPPMAHAQPAQFGMPGANPNALAYQTPQMTPMMQMQMMGMGMGGMGMGPGGQFGVQAMHQSVMRHPSPAPPGADNGGQGFANF
ncbi:YT521-B-like domain-containing protein [Mycena maculata]|uniref:YT521-B-like domain-containing protein n=1 Tax=Mycena maculata TaxID=230809 RepID=A0AAD7I6P1_9AGAR|nr:YT521-B-like domain-containing protein [Mycena maculata]